MKNINLLKQCFLVVLLLSGFCLADNKVTLNIILTPDLPTMSRQETLQRFQKLPSLNLVIATFNYAPADYPGLSILPGYFFEQDLQDQTNVYELLAQNKMLREDRKNFGRKTYEVLPGRGFAPQLYLKRQKIPGQIEVFYSPYCPPCLYLVLTLLKIQRQDPRKFKKIILTPLVAKKDWSDPNQNISDLEKKYTTNYGLEELEEKVREAIIYEKWPDKLLPYLTKRKDNIRTPFWSYIAEEVGLDVKAIEQEVQNRRERILAQAAKRASAEYFVKNSPTIIWENNKQYNHLLELNSEPELKFLLAEIVKNNK